MLTFKKPPPGFGHDISSSSWKPRPLRGSVNDLFAITAIKLRATPLGIRKLDLGANGGRILFTAQPNLDPMTIIKLIQTQPRTYALDGQDKLKIKMELPGAAERISTASRLIELLS